MNNQIISTNRKAFHDYNLLDKFECGIVLEGNEVKAIREGKLNIKESFARFKKNELFIWNMYIGQYSHLSIANYSPTRTRKLLLNSKELDKIFIYTNQKHRTIIPIRAYFKKGKVKIEIALVQAKKKWDKRRTVKERDLDQEISRKLKGI